MTWDLFSSAEKVKEPPSGRRDERTVRGRGGGAVERMRVSSARPGEEWSVAEVNAAARELVEGVFPPLWITGEVANFTRARSGHCYFTLRDGNAQLRCVMWRDDALRLPTTPEEGMSVRALGRLTVYAQRGDFQASVTELVAKGDGLWKLALERLRRKLEAEGLTDPARKRPLPRYPRVIGVVTSPSGAVFHDIVNVVRRRAPWTRVVLAGCRVQGDGAAADIAGAIRRLAAHGRAEVLIVGRGGGSAEDLWAFNEEVVARAIAGCPVPVISAVGHETDVTIADLVADLRAPTPSAAAESAVPDRGDLLRNLQRDGWRLRQGIAARLGHAQDEVGYARSRLFESGARLTDGARERVRVAARQLEALSPMSAFARGYAVPLSPEGRTLRTAGDFPPGQPFNLRISDGSIPCRVDEGPKLTSAPPPDHGLS